MAKQAQLRQQSLRHEITEAAFALECKESYAENLQRVFTTNRRNYVKLGEQMERVDQKLINAYPELRAREKQIADEVQLVLHPVGVACSAPHVMYLYAALF